MTCSSKFVRYDGQNWEVIFKASGQCDLEPLSGNPNGPITFVDCNDCTSIALSKISIQLSENVNANIVQVYKNGNVRLHSDDGKVKIRSAKVDTLTMTISD